MAEVDGLHLKAASVGGLRRRDRPACPPGLPGGARHSEPDDAATDQSTGVVKSARRRPYPPVPVWIGIRVWPVRIEIRTCGNIRRWRAPRASIRPVGDEVRGGDERRQWRSRAKRARSDGRAAYVVVTC